MGKIVMPTLVLSFIALVMVIGAISPAMADSDGSKSYKRHWAIPIGTAEGSLEITEENTKEQLKEIAISLDDLDLTSYPEISKARLGKAVNDDGKYFLVWKLINKNHDTESDTTIKTIYVLDAGNGATLLDEPITKEGGSCGNKDRSKTSGESA